MRTSIRKRSQETNGKSQLVERKGKENRAKKAIRGPRSKARKATAHRRLVRLGLLGDGS